MMDRTGVRRDLPVTDSVLQNTNVYVLLGQYQTNTYVYFNLVTCLPCCINIPKSLVTGYLFAVFISVSRTLVAP